MGAPPGFIFRASLCRLPPRGQPETACALCRYGAELNRAQLTRRNLKALLAYGLEPATALQEATMNPADQWLDWNFWEGG